MTASKRVVLHNDKSRAVLLPERGGLLAELTLADGEALCPLLWTNPEFKGDATDWPLAGCPVLFPFAGRVWDDGVVGKYRLDNKQYAMPLHGFAYSEKWKVEDSDATSCTLLLVDSLASRQQFPFVFELRAHYQLLPNQLDITLHLTHVAPLAPMRPHAQMPVAMGLHPFFRVPLSADGPWQQNQFHCDAQARIEVTKEGNAANATTPRAADVEELTAATLRSAILTDLTYPACALVDPQGGIIITMSWQDCATDVRNVVLWSKPEAGYFCMEPWMGLPDAPHRLETKKIAAGESLRLDFAVRLASER